MARPVFLSSAWRAGEPHPNAAGLDAQLRFRGVPIWRDVRDLGAGGANEEVAREAITGLCSGLVLYFNRPVLDSWFISSVELRAVRQRLDRDPDFFVAALFDGTGGDQARELAETVGVDMRAFQGYDLDPEPAPEPQLREFADQLLDRYLSRAENRTRIRVATRDEVAWVDESSLQLNWGGLLGDDDTPPRDGAWGEIRSAVRAVRQGLQRAGDERSLAVSGSIHLSAAFAIGWEFREATGWGIECEHPRAPAATEAINGDPQGWHLRTLSSQNDSDELVVRVGMAKDPADAVRHHRRTTEPRRAEISLLPPDGSAARTAADDIDLNALAAALVGEIQSARSDYGVARTELYLACPWSFALLLGWHFASSGRVRVWEATADKSTYYDDPLSLP